ncbi:MAG: NADH-quinone oxidoreductase subunit L [Actinomycetes bacterium]
MSAALVMVVLPALGAAGGLLVGGMSRKASALIAVLGPAAALVVSLQLAAGHPWVDPTSDTGFVSSVQAFPAATVVDGMSVSVAVMVCFVATLVQVYSIGYMRREPRYASYSAFISLFTAGMLAVVVAGDLLTLVIGWEVMGLCSYLLIGQDWERQEARSAAVKAFLVTMIGDVGFIVGVVVLIGTTGTSSIPDAVRAAAGDPTVAVVASVLILLGVLGKSAQFPLHAWLPDAMAGPSPVSALIHAATMVAAGIYVVARLYPMFLAAPGVLTLMAVIACLSMLGAAVVALAQSDLKRVLAWSTVSQLAYMMAALAVGSRDAAIFHLLSHAFFKALLFLAAGVVIHELGTSSLSQLGGLRRAMPWTFGTMTIGLLALVGVFPLAGFFSKESILIAAGHATEGDAQVAPWVGWLVLVVSIMTIAVTAAYATRLGALTWLGGRRSAMTAREGPAVMTVPLVLLAVPTVFFGWLGWTHQWLPAWMAATATQPLSPVTDLSPELLAALASTLAVVAGVLAWVLGRRQISRWLPEGGFAAGGFGMDTAYEWLVVRPYLWLVRRVTAFDRRVIARTVAEVGASTQLVGAGIQTRHRGDVQRYISAAFTAIVVVLVLLLVAVAT